MFHKLSFALLFAVLTCGQIASAQVPQSGKCPNVKLSKFFHWHDFEGVWFEYSRYPTDSETGQDCVYGTYKSISIDTMGIIIVAANKSNIPVTYDVTGKILGPGAFLAIFNGKGPKRIDKILDTDYKSWAVIYNCEEAGKKHNDRAWILTRARNPNADSVRKAKLVLNRYKLSTKFLVETRQNNCP